MDVIVEELTSEQGTAMFDRLSQETLGISGLEFLTNYDKGVYTGHDCGKRDDLCRLIMLIPFARP